MIQIRILPPKHGGKRNRLGRSREFKLPRHWPVVHNVLVTNNPQTRTALRYTMHFGIQDLELNSVHLLIVVVADVLKPFGFQQK